MRAKLLVGIYLLSAIVQAAIVQDRAGITSQELNRLSVRNLAVNLMQNSAVATLGECSCHPGCPVVSHPIHPNPVPEYRSSQDDKDGNYHPNCGGGCPCICNEKIKLALDLKVPGDFILFDLLAKAKGHSHFALKLDGQGQVTDVEVKARHMGCCPHLHPTYGAEYGETDPTRPK